MNDIPIAVSVIPIRAIAFKNQRSSVKGVGFPLWGAMCLGG
jgi:hypothetical protein